MDVSYHRTLISEDIVTREVHPHSARSRQAARQERLQALSIRELLLRQAERLGIEPAPEPDETEDEALIRQVIEREVAITEPDELSCRRYFQKYRDVLATGYLYTVSHILLLAPAEPLAREQVRRKARELIKVLDGDMSRFTALAATYSDCPSREIGGDLGPLRPGQVVPEFEQALHRLIPGEIAPEPIKTRYGYHIVYLASRQGGEAAAFEQARPRIIAALRERNFRRALAAYIQRLVSRLGN